MRRDPGRHQRQQDGREHAQRDEHRRQGARGEVLVRQQPVHVLAGQCGTGAAEAGHRDDTGGLVRDEVPRGPDVGEQLGRVGQTGLVDGAREFAVAFRDSLARALAQQFR